MSYSTSSNPDIKENIKNFWNERSRTFDDDIGHGADEVERQLWKQYLTDIIGPDPKKVLDVGTGTGMIAINLAELGHTVTGIDLGEKMMEIARRKAEEKELPIIFKIGDAEEPDFPDNTFDCVICRHLLGTLPHPDTAIREWSRICRSGGMIIAIDGHSKPHEYFPEVDTSDLNTRSDREKLWHAMYSKDVIEHLPLKNDMTVQSLASFFSLQNISDVKTQYISDISDYQKSLMEMRKEESEHCEVNVIWGRVQK